MSRTLPLPSHLLALPLLDERVGLHLHVVLDRLARGLDGGAAKGPGWEGVVGPPGVPDDRPWVHQVWVLELAHDGRGRVAVLIGGGLLGE